MVERSISAKIKAFYTDMGGEFVVMHKFLTPLGIFLDILALTLINKMVLLT